MSRLNFWDKFTKGGGHITFARFFFYVLVFLVPIGTRKLLFQFTFGFDEYEAVWFYASDIAATLFLVAVWVGVWKKPQSVSALPLFSRIAFSLFLLCAAISIFVAHLKLFALAQMVRLLFLVVVAYTTALLVMAKEISRKKVFAILGTLAAIESVIAFLQFAWQQSLGLWFLGESVVGPAIGGTAKIIIQGGALMRGYGTFPHPNVLGAFLLLGLFALSYLFLCNMNRKGERKLFGRVIKLPPVNAETVLLLLGINLILLGLVLTFSRSAWGVGLVALVIFFAGMMKWGREYRISRSPLFALAVALVIFSGTIAWKMQWAMFPRAQLSMNEPAVLYRLSYNELGLALAEKNPMGVGIGNSVFVAVKNGFYEKFGMSRVWEWQPIHNIYLLILAEIGMVGLLAFLFGVVCLHGPWERGKKKVSDPEFFTAGVMLFALLLLGLSDHFLWTLQPGRLMLWLTIGLMVRLAPTPNKLYKK